MRLDGSTFPEAVHTLGEYSGHMPAAESRRSTPRSTAVRAPAIPPERPSGLSPADALALVEYAARRLWSPEGARALSYLHGRGLTDETIHAARLGYVDSARIPTKDGDRSYRASGVSIPWYDGDRLALVKIRQPEGTKPKYVEAYRDRPRIYPGPEAIRPGRRLIVPEGEFDALLLAQRLHGAAGVVTLGSASARPSLDILVEMLAAPRWLIATDADRAGDGAATGWPSRAERVWPPEPFNDWTEADQAGIDLRWWWLSRLGEVDALWNELAGERWGPALTEADEDGPDAYAVAERLAIQSEPPLTDRA